MADALYNLIVIDTEAGGLDPLQHSIIELGAVHCGTGRKFSVLIDEGPQRCLTKSAERIHGITEEEIRERGVTPAVAVSLFEDWLYDVCGTSRPRIAGHNVTFDDNMLRRLYRLAEASYELDFRTIDTHTVFWLMGQMGLLPFERITTQRVFDHFGIEVPSGQRHRALADAEATCKAFRRAIELLLPA